MSRRVCKCRDSGVRVALLGAASRMDHISWCCPGVSEGSLSNVVVSRNWSADF